MRTLCDACRLGCDFGVYYYIMNSSTAHRTRTRPRGYLYHVWGTSRTGRNTRAPYHWSPERMPDHATSHWTASRKLGETGRGEPCEQRAPSAARPHAHSRPRHLDGAHRLATTWGRLGHACRCEALSLIHVRRLVVAAAAATARGIPEAGVDAALHVVCLLYTSPSPRDS